MNFLIFLTFSIFINVFGSLTRMRIQQQTKEGMSEQGKEAFDEHIKGMEKFVSMSNELNNIKKASSDSSKPLKKSKLNNPSLYQGDIILSKDQMNYLIDEAKIKLEAKNSNQSDSLTKSAIDKLKKNRAFKKNSPFKWSFPIKYFIVPPADAEAIDSALKNMENLTCIRFKKTAPFSNSPGLRFFKGDGCFSAIGQEFKNKPQDVSIGSGCEWNGIVQHEVCHALGVFHEQSRPNRNDYLTVLIENVAKDMRFNYDISSLAESNAFGIPYNYGSHMQYDRSSFSNNDKDVMIPKDPNFLYTLGQYGSMQFNDVKLINTVFCSNKCSGGVKCLNGGYEDPNKCGTCLCPSMLGGADCNSVAKNPEECGGCNTYIATSESKTFKLEGIKDCSYLIKSNNNKVVEITIDEANLLELEDVCTVGETLEIKYIRDKTSCGATFCGKIKGKKIEGKTSQVLLRYVGTEEDHNAAISYREI